jgi:NAD(P)-dependent dehydrogenase (short-subunit alcohol dehydrogenase family)
MKTSHYVHFAFESFCSALQIPRHALLFYAVPTQASGHLLASVRQLRSPEQLMNYSPLYPIEGRIAVVTGAAGGIGFEACRALQANGATVVSIDVRKEAGRERADQLGIDFYPGDLTDSKTVANLASEIQSRYGRIDIAVNNSGVAFSAPGEDHTDEQWHQVMNINLHAVFYCCREFGKVMLEQGKGSIINTASMSGIVSNTPQPQVAYNASKAAVIMLTKSLAGEWAKRGVRVNSISPGYVNTPMSQGGMANNDWYPRWIEFTPMARVGEPSEIAPAVVFLASDASSYFTGTNLVIDGGYTCW